MDVGRNALAGGHVAAMLAANEGLFVRRVAPQSGIVSWVLRAEPLVSIQSLYFGAPGCDDAFRVIWFAWSKPWAGTAREGRMLGVVDLERGEVRYLADHRFIEAGATVLPDSGDLIWINGTEAWRRSPRADDVPRRLGGLPWEMWHRRLLNRVGTQPTLSADGNFLLLDTRIGTRSFVGGIALPAGHYETWFSSPLIFNHARFSPTDPNLVLLARDDLHDFDTGVSTPYDHRMFLYDRRGSLLPIGPEGRHVGHEVWAADGRAIWFVHFREGVMRYDLGTGRSELIWPGTGWHTHASACERYVVADHRISAKRGGPAWIIRFLNRVTGKQVEVARRPVPEQDRLHQDPHPRFGAADEAVIYTTQEDGRPSLAVVPVADLIAATS